MQTQPVTSPVAVLSPVQVNPRRPAKVARVALEIAPVLRQLISCGQSPQGNPGVARM